MPKVAVQIVTYNSLRYIFDCMESLMRQTFRDFSIIIIDNASADGTINFLRSNYPNVNILQNFKNFGFARATNQGILMAKGEYVLSLNPDVILTENYLEQLVSFADQKPQGASFGGKILKLKTEYIDDIDKSGMIQAIKSNYLDSTGLEIAKSRRTVDRGEGELDQGQYDRIEEVFGLTGACVLYRKSALDEIMINNEVVDQDFVAYKDDVDLSWRLRLYGFQNWYHPQIICYHHRGFPGRSAGMIKALASRRKISKVLRGFSFCNQHLMLVKNDEFVNILLALPWFLAREIKLIFLTLLLEPFQIKTVIRFFKLLPKTIAKRRIIMRHKKTTALEMRKWYK